MTPLSNRTLLGREVNLVSFLVLFERGQVERQALDPRLLLSSA